MGKKVKYTETEFAIIKGEGNLRNLYVYLTIIMKMSKKEALDYIEDYINERRKF